MIKKIIAWFFILVLFGCGGDNNPLNQLIPLATAEGATTYYIDYNASDDSANGTTKSTPWKRCPGMVGFAGSYSHANGDTFVFKGGVTWPYVSGDAVLIVGYSGGGVGTEDTYTSDQTWYTGGAWDYPVFNGGNPAEAIFGIESIGKSNIIFEYIKFLNMGDSTNGSSQAIFILGGSNVHTRYNYISSNCVNCWSYGGSGTTQDVYFHHNIIRQCGRVNVDIGDNRLSNLQMYNNIMEGGWDWSPSNGYHTDGFMIGGDGVADYAIKNLKIYNNKFWGDWQLGATAQIYLTGSIGNKNSQTTRIYNNLFTTSNITSYGGWINGIIAKYGHDGLEIYNNTFDYRGSTNAPNECVLYYTNVKNIAVKNNIFVGCDTGVAFDDLLAGTNVIDNNLFYTRNSNHIIYDIAAANRYDTCGAAQAAGWATNYCSVSNPVFVTDPTAADNDDLGYGINNGNWVLQSNSPAVNHGEDLSAIFTTDYVGNTRPTGANTWDIGAYEYGGGETPPSPVTVTISKTGVGCSLDPNGDRPVIIGETLNIVLTLNNGWKGTWNGTCPATGTTTRICTPTEASTVTYVCEEIKLPPWTK